MSAAWRPADGEVGGFAARLEFGEAPAVRETLRDRVLERQRVPAADCASTTAGVNDIKSAAANLISAFL